MRNFLYINPINFKLLINIIKSIAWVYRGLFLNIKEHLKKYFGYDDFLPGQEEVVNRILKGENLFVIMPTGGGKSLCYQLPAVIMDGIVLVVSPLIALMKDQVDQLNSWGIPSTFINSSITSIEISNRLHEIANRKYRLVYVAPERFYNRNFVLQLKELKISLFVIDEAHCISEWGHDFRPSYLRLKRVADYLKIRSIIALTATATTEVRSDIIANLGLSADNEVITGFHRPNLFFMTDRIDSENKRLEKLKRIVCKVQGSLIVYAGTRKVVDKITTAFVNEKIKAVSYHAGLTDEDRKNNQELFLNDSVRIIVCTNAFGMGINKKNVRGVIHFNLPGSLEAYYQEAGRAGRDGKRSFCILLYGYGDRYLQEFFIQGSYPDKELIKEVYSVLDAENEEIILKTHDEIQKCLSANKVNDMAISSILRILEDNNIVERLSEKNHKASLKLLLNFDEALDSIDTRAEIQRLVLGNIMEIYENAIYTGIQFYPDDLAVKCRIPKDSLMRAITALNEKNIIEYRAPFRGRGIRMIQKNLDTNNLPIRYDLLEERAGKEYQRLRIMEGYVFNKGCRHFYLLRYFGDKTLNGDNCNSCDTCVKPDVKAENDSCEIAEKNTEITVDKNNLIEAVLYTIKSYPDRFGQKVIVDILKGSNNQQIRKWNLKKTKHYGQYRDLSREDIESVISNLAIKGFLIRQKGLYPVLNLSQTGFEYLLNSGKEEKRESQSLTSNIIINYEKEIIKAIIKNGMNFEKSKKEISSTIPEQEIKKVLNRIEKDFIEFLKMKYPEGE